MERHNNLVIMGQDVAEYGGAFKITDGFVAQFSKERVINTPICESRSICGNGIVHQRIQSDCRNAVLILFRQDSIQL
jgi:pyruvate/2-oxoglutarate/acetoin dehydrogenase E1 component